MSSEESASSRPRQHRRKAAAVVLGMALVGSVALATTAEADHILSGDVRATAVHGSISKCPTGTTLLYAPNGGSASGPGVTATVAGQYLDLTFVGLDGADVTAYVKGANAYNQYLIEVGTTDTNDLHAPLNARGNIPAVSHYLLCQTSAPDPLFEEPKVFLAYADTFHTGAGGVLFKPTPWEGPGVTFLGCNDSNCGGDGKFDGGAIRLDNVDPQPMQLTAATVTITDASGSTCTFRPWDGLLPATAGVGESFILTQTGGLGPIMPAPCRNHIPEPYWPLTNFDTSEPPGPIQCDPLKGGVPAIHLEFGNGVVLDLQDTDQILNTDGVDRATCFGVTEATPWTELLY